MEVSLTKEYILQVNNEITEETKTVAKIRENVKEMEKEYTQKGLNVREIINKDFTR